MTRRTNKARASDFKKIEIGLDYLINDDAYLLRNDLNERAITHKLAEYYQILFRGWNVDCEYNKNLERAKEISIHPKFFLSRMAACLENKDSEISKLTKNDISSEDIRNLMEQLKKPRTKYIDDLDLWVFLLKISPKKIIRKTIFPDIIIHRRGTMDNNIVIEAKKTTNTDRKSRLYDLLKLATLVSNPEYKYNEGIFIELPTSSRFIPPVNFSKYKNSLEVYEYHSV
ncbi:hypothetical protein HY416_01705 [Candidatus Kaiserbacteria bacterium]|nr:hypothetical protein [Candidatus Kaiserbacteria bacterium]